MTSYIGKNVKRLLRDRIRFYEKEIKKHEAVIANFRRQMKPLVAEYDAMLHKTSLPSLTKIRPRSEPRAKIPSTTIKHWKAPDHNAPRRELQAAVDEATRSATSLGVADDEPIGA